MDQKNVIRRLARDEYSPDKMKEQEVISWKVKQSNELEREVRDRLKKIRSTISYQSEQNNGITEAQGNLPVMTHPNLQYWRDYDSVNSKNSKSIRLLNPDENENILPKVTGASPIHSKNKTQNPTNYPDPSNKSSTKNPKDNLRNNVRFDNQQSRKPYTSFYTSPNRQDDGGEDGSGDEQVVMDNLQKKVNARQKSIDLINQQLQDNRNSEFTPPVNQKQLSQKQAQSKFLPDLVVPSFPSPKVSNVMPRKSREGYPKVSPIRFFAKSQEPKGLEELKKFDLLRKGNKYESFAPAPAQNSQKDQNVNEKNKNYQDDVDDDDDDQTNYSDNNKNTRSTVDEYKKADNTIQDRERIQQPRQNKLDWSDQEQDMEVKIKQSNQEVPFLKEQLQGKQIEIDKLTNMLMEQRGELKNAKDDCERLKQKCRDYELGIATVEKDAKLIETQYEVKRLMQDSNLEKDLYLRFNEELQRENREILAKAEKLMMKYQALQGEQSKVVSQLEENMHWKDMLDQKEKEITITKRELQYIKQNSMGDLEEHKKVLQKLCQHLNTYDIHQVLNIVIRLAADNIKHTQFQAQFWDIIQPTHTNQNKSPTPQASWDTFKSIYGEFLELRKKERADINLGNIFMKSLNLKSREDIIPVFTRKVIENEEYMRVISKVKQCLQITSDCSLQELSVNIEQLFRKKLYS